MAIVDRTSTQHVATKNEFGLEEKGEYDKNFFFSKGDRFLILWRGI